MSHLVKTTQLWDKNARDWSSGIRDGLDVINNEFGLPFFVNQLPDIKGKTILDAGCGEGRSTRAIVRPGARTIGVDISSSMLNFARSEEAERPQDIEYLKASCHALDVIESKSIDIVTSYMSLMDMPDIDLAMAEFARVLKPHGEIFIMVRHPCFFTPGFSVYQSRTGERTGLTVSDYFKNDAYIDQFSFQERPKAQFEVVRFPYTLSHYVSSLQKNGFNLEDLQEPTPPAALCAAYPRLNFWKTHAGIFLFLHGALRNDAG